MAIASLVCGILGFMLCLPSIGAVVCGHIARAQIRQEPQGGEGLALAGLITGYIVLAGIVIYILVMVLGFGALAFGAAATGAGSVINTGP
jgi:hypothetical protein